MLGGEVGGAGERLVGAFRPERVRQGGATLDQMLGRLVERKVERGERPVKDFDPITGQNARTQTRRERQDSGINLLSEVLGQGSFTAEQAAEMTRDLVESFKARDAQVARSGRDREIRRDRGKGVIRPRRGLGRDDERETIGFD